MKTIEASFKNGMIGIRDDVAAMLDIQWKIKHARHKVRDEKNRITWVYDRLFGLTE